MNTVTAATGNYSTAQGSVAQNPDAALGRDDFLRLLVTQLQHQDPIEPMKDQEFAAQLAQFSSLEAVQSLSAQFQQFVSMQQWAVQLTQATGLIGKTVDLVVDNTLVTGTVSAVRTINNTVQLVVDDKTYDISLLAQVRA